MSYNPKFCLPVFMFVKFLGVEAGDKEEEKEETGGVNEEGRKRGANY